MAFFDTLTEATAQERQHLLSAPIIGKALAGNITLDEYVAFLEQAYHHVKHTTPLLMAVGSRLPEDKEWLRDAVAEYIEEEVGHQEWILNDIAMCGYDKEVVRHSTPHPETELMVAYAYDMVSRISPIGFFGMVQVLEGTSVSIAENAADKIRETLNLPKKAFSYMYSHGSLDQEHVKFFENLMNRIESPEDQALIIHAAKMFYRLYGDIFRSLHSDHGIPLAA
ncbi:MAG: iron-containing redox enzyme family protein [Gammaproteobacteria bacterium]|nr:MAG: iron-containing redox enzyme family protein [Gammaproteobacteria bacterium]